MKSFVAVLAPPLSVLVYGKNVDAAQPSKGACPANRPVTNGSLYGRLSRDMECTEGEPLAVFPQTIRVIERALKAAVASPSQVDEHVGGLA